MRMPFFNHVLSSVIVLSISGIVSAGEIPQQVKDLRKAADQRLASGDMAGAVDTCRKIQQSFPDTSYAVEAQRQIVGAYIRNNSNDQAKAALAEFKQKYADRPEYVQQVHEVAWDFVGKGDYAAALQAYQDLQRDFPDHSRAVWFQRSIVQTYLEQGDLANVSQAVDDLKNNYRTHPDYANQMKVTADRLRSRRQYEAAAGIYDQLLKDKPNDTQAVIWKRLKIQNALDLGQKESARSDLEEMMSAYKDSPEFVRQVHELGWEFVVRGDTATGMQIYTALRDQFPAHPRAVWFQRSIIQTCLSQGNAEQALKEVEVLKNDYSSHPDYRNQMEAMVGILVDNNQPAAAKGICDKLLETFPSHSRLPWFLQAKARSEVWMKDSDAADATVEMMQSKYGKDPNYPDAMSWTAYEYRRAGYYERAIELYELLLAQKPDPKVRLRSIASIAQSYARLGKDAAVMEKVEYLLSHFKDNPAGVAFYVFGIGEEYYLMAQEVSQAGKPDRAESCYRNALTVWQRFEQAVPDHNSPQYPYFCGITYHRLGQYEQAVVSFQKIISIWPGYEKSWHARYMITDCLAVLAAAGKVDKTQAEALKQAQYRLIVQKHFDCPVADFVRQALNSQAQ